MSKWDEQLNWWRLVKTHLASHVGFDDEYRVVRNMDGNWKRCYVLNKKESPVLVVSWLQNGELAKKVSAICPVEGVTFYVRFLPGGEEEEIFQRMGELQLDNGSDMGSVVLEAEWSNGYRSKINLLVVFLALSLVT